MPGATVTTNHDEIRSWVEERGGHPALAEAAGPIAGEGAVLRIDFGERPGESGLKDRGLRRIGWEDFFALFDRRKLAFLRQELGASRFNKLVEREAARV